MKNDNNRLSVTSYNVVTLFYDLSVNVRWMPLLGLITRLGTGSVTGAPAATLNVNLKLHETKCKTKTNVESRTPQYRVCSSVDILSKLKCSWYRVIIPVDNSIC